MLDNMLADLVSLGIIPAIVTWNSQAAVERALSMRAPPGKDLLKYFRLVPQGLIFGREVQDSDKYITVRDRIMGPLKLSPDDVLFVDDNPSNVDSVAAECGCAGMYVAGKEGLTQSECDAVMQWASECRLPANGPNGVYE